MRRLMLIGGACLLASSALGAPAIAKSKADDSTCHLKNYSHLVGAHIAQTTSIGGDFRLLEAGRDPGPVLPKRLTIVYDGGDSRIVSVSCG